MRAPRFEFETHESVFSETFQHLVVRHRTPAVLVYRHFFSVFFAASNGLVHHTFVLFEVAVAKPVIYSSRTLFFYLRGKALVRLVVFGNDKQSRRILVESMHDTGTNDAVYAAQTVETVEQRIDERVVFFVRACLMHNHALRLVDNRHILVLVHDIERDILRLDFERFGRGYIKLHNVADFEFESAFLSFYAVNESTVSFDDGLCVGARYAPLGRNKYVQSYVVFVNGMRHKKLFDFVALVRFFVVVGVVFKFLRFFVVFGLFFRSFLRFVFFFLLAHDKGIIVLRFHHRIEVDGSVERIRLLLIVSDNLLLFFKFFLVFLALFHQHNDKYDDKHKRADRNERVRNVKHGETLPECKLNEVAHVSKRNAVNDVAYSAGGDENEGYSKPLALFQSKEKIYANADYHDKRYDGQCNRFALKYTEACAHIFDHNEIEKIGYQLFYAVVFKILPRRLLGEQVRNENYCDNRKFDKVNPPFLFYDARPLRKKGFDLFFKVRFFLISHKNSLSSDLRRNGYRHPLRSKEKNIFGDLLYASVKSVNRAAHKVENSVHRLLIERGKINDDLFSHFEVIDEQLHVLVGARRIDYDAARLSVGGRLRIARHLRSGRGLARENSSPVLHIRTLCLIVSEIPFVHMLFLYYAFCIVDSRKA